MMVTENRRKNYCFLLFNPIIAQICTVCNSICKKKIGKLQKKSGTAIGFAAPDSVLLSADATYFRNRLRMMSVPSLIPPPTSTHSKINPNKPPIQHTSFLKKTTGFLFSYKCIVSFQLFKNDKTADFFAQKQTQTESLSELFFRILFLHLLIGVCLIIKYSIVRLLYCFCWLLHIVYDVWTGTPYQCRCAGCSRLFAGITTPVLIKIHCTMFRMFVSVRMMES